MSQNPIKARRKELGLTAEQVAVKARTTVATLYHLESGRRRGCNVYTAQRLAEALETTVAMLFPPAMASEAAA